jgi:hypothetical protein
MLHWEIFQNESSVRYNPSLSGRLNMQLSAKDSRLSCLLYMKVADSIEVMLLLEKSREYSFFKDENACELTRMILL